MRKKSLLNSLILLFILFSGGSVLPQGSNPFVFDFPVIVAGAGNETDLYATAFCSLDEEGTVTLEAEVFGQNGEVVDTKQEELICNGTVPITFTGGENLVFGHNQITIDGPAQGVLIIEIIRLNLEGAAPLGVATQDSCQTASVTVIRNDELNAALAVSSTSSDPLACKVDTYSADGTLMGEETFAVPAFGQNQFFFSEITVLPDVFNGWADISCGGADFFAISFFQTRLGGLTTNPLDCVGGGEDSD